MQDGGGLPSAAGKSITMQFLSEDFYPPVFDNMNYVANIENEKVKRLCGVYAFYFIPYTAVYSRLTL